MSSNYKEARAVAKRTEMEKRCLKFAIALVVLGVIAVAVAVFCIEGCGRPSAPTSFSPLIAQEGESTQVPEPTSGSTEGRREGQEKKAGLSELVVEAWFADRSAFSRSLRPMLLEVGTQLILYHYEGAGHLSEGAGEGDYDCLFRWSILEEPFLGVSSESFSSQFPGWTCNARIVFLGGHKGDPGKVAESVSLWKACVVLADPKSDREVEWHDKYIRAVFSWREGCEPDEPLFIPGDVGEESYSYSA